MQIEDGRDVLASTGICREPLHPYPIQEKHIRTKPSSAAFEDALQHRLGRTGIRLRMAEITDTSRAAGIRDRLLEGCPVVIGFRRPNQFPTGVLNAQFEWMDPEASRSPHSGHCVLITGFSDARRAVHVHDSEGLSRFDHGGWWMGYRVVDSPMVEKVFYLIP
jgi:hypothetical protein